MCVHVPVCVLVRLSALCQCVKQWVEGTKTQTVTIPCGPQIKHDNGSLIDTEEQSEKSVSVFG